MKSLLFTLILCIGTCVVAFDPKEIPMASVMANSTGLHLCNAFFYTHKYLITTASCVNCEKCFYFITLNSDFLMEDSSKVYEVEEIKIHPNYTTNPDMYNVAKLILKEEVKDVIVYKPAMPSELIPGNGSFPTWSFDENRNYVMRENFGTYVDREIYHRGTGLRVQDYQICVMTDNPTSTGPYDEGSPFSRKVNEEYIVYGYFSNVQIQKYGKLFPLMSMSHLFNAASRSFFYDTDYTE